MAFVATALQLSFPILPPPLPPSALVPSHWPFPLFPQGDWLAAALRGHFTIYLQTMQAKRGHVLRDKANAVTWVNLSEGGMCVHYIILTFG